MIPQINRTRVFISSLAFLASSLARPAWADFTLNMPVGVTPTSREIYSLHMMALWVCVVIGLIVYGAMVIAIVRFRKSTGAKPAKFTHNSTIEVIWTVIPAVILVAMAVPAAEGLIRMEDTRDADLTVKITGLQWRWQYDYIDEGVKFYSVLGRDSNAARRRGSGIDPATVENYLLEVDNPLVVPVDAKVRLLVTGADVIHAWWVPELGVKKDAVPGYINETWFTAETEGTYRGQCAELCGMDHGFMPIVVRVVPQEEYDTWLTSRKATAQTSATDSAR
jgi:cytochrome c oxidase subunit 2